MTIRSDGWVVPCSGFWEYKIGDIRKESIAEIWNHSRALNAIRKVQDVKLCANKACKACDFISFCNGGCRAVAYYASRGNLKSVDATKCAIYATNALQRISEKI